ncbi:hypothetical protein BDF21DRAFT_396185 [Thamnidium elegans]|nr:hypothetical protein BDF21DRAFT_396185 [Thamnidium elegans]
MSKKRLNSQSYKKKSLVTPASLLRKKAFINYYIIKRPQNLPNVCFQQNFWHSSCRVVCEQLSINDFQSKYANIHHLEDLWMELNNHEHINLIVAKDGMRNYGQVFSTACETIAMCYNNDCIENFQNTIYNFLMLRSLSAFINPLIVELKNRSPSFSITKVTQNTNPFSILPALRHILSKYESFDCRKPYYADT